MIFSNTEFEILFQDETAPGVAIPESGEGKVRGWQKEPLSIMWCLNSFVAESSSQSRLIYASTGFPDLFLYLLKVAFIQKAWMNLSFPQTDKPHYFPEFEF